MNKKVVRRTLTILQLTDGVWVIESTKPFHHPGANYVEEARLSLFGIFKREPKLYLPRDKAYRALSEIVGGMDKGDLYSSGDFKHNSVEYHLVLAPFDQFLFSSRLFDYQKKTKNWMITPLSEHPMAERINERLKPKN